MDTSGNKQVDYNSADIKHKQKPELITNIKKTNAAERLGKEVFTKESRPVFLAGIFLVLSIILLTVVVVTINIRDATITDNPQDNNVPADVIEVESDIAGINPDSSGDEYLTAIAKLDTMLAAAENDAAKYHQLLLVKIDFMIRNTHERVAIDDVILPSLDQTSNTIYQYDLLQRAVKAYLSLPDESASLKIMLERILSLPDNVFPNTTDDTYRDYYEKLAREI